MNCARFLSVFIFFLITSYSLKAQQIELKGIITDRDTGEPVPFASVSIADLYKGTSSNANGEYLIKVDSLPIRLIFSHISYKKQEQTINDTSVLEIRLIPGEILLEELVVEDKDKGEYAYSLLIRALGETINNSRNWKYGLAFYRQISTNDDEYSELYEIFYDTRYSSMGIVDWAVQEGRYAMDLGKEASSYVFNKNFTLLTRLITMYQPLTDDFIMPVNQDVRDLYDVNMNGLKDVQGRKVAIIGFTAKEEIYTPAMEGEIMIDIDSYEILKLDAYFKTDELEIIALNNPEGSWKNHILNIEVVYKPEGEELYLDYIRLSQSFDYFIEGVYQHNVNTNSLLTYYEYYQPEKFKRLGGRLIRYNRSDREMLDRIGYNKRFWENNPVVLRTPIEEKVIASFEAQNAFGTIFLNDRDEVELERDNLDFDPFIQKIQFDLKKSKIPTSGEKVYLHTDKPFYASGETIWFSATLVNLASHIPTNISGVLYVDLISPQGEILIHKRLELQQGFSEGHIDLENKLPTGKYRLRAYTNWMKNYDKSFFFDRELEIFNPEEKLKSSPRENNEIKNYSVDFLPEGGHLVNGIPSQIAFKAIDENGKSIDVSGKIIDNQGNQVAEINTRHDGMGSFFILPQKDFEFTAEVKYKGIKKTFELPKALNSGYILTVNNLKNRVIQVTIRSSEDLDDSDFYIVGQTRGILYHREKATIKRNIKVLNIPKTKLPSGIFHITLFDDNHNPRCERLVFIDNNTETFVKNNSDIGLLGNRDKINLALELTDQFDRSLRNARFSIAVTDVDHLLKKPESENIKTNLLLTSDLKGRINNPGYYFMNNDRGTLIELDLVMLTHGWRRFTWQQIFDGSLTNTEYSHEFGIRFSGTAFHENTRRPLKFSYVNLMSVSNQYPGFWSGTTDIDGKFQIYDVDLPDTLSAIAISADHKGDPVEINIKLDELEKYPAEQQTFQKIPPEINETVVNYMKGSEERKKIKEAYNFSETIVMKEIEIRGTRERNSSIYGEPDAVIELDDEINYYQDIFQIIQGRVPGVLVTGQGMNASIRIRGVGSISLNNDPLFVVDGMPMGNPDIPAFSSDSTGAAGGGDNSGINSMLLSINPRDIDRIEILKGGKAAIYGSRGANGVILIYTKSGNDFDDVDSNFDEKIIHLPGYSYIKEFYSPDYDVPNEKHVMPDKRTTVFWHPSVNTNNLGQAEIKFFNSDEAKTLQIELQGVTDFGDIINATFFIGKELEN